MPVLIAVLLLIVAAVLLVVGVISTIVVWGSGSVLYMVISGVRQARLSRELDTSSGIAPFVSLSLVDREVHAVANDTTVQMRVEQEHRLARRFALGGCAAILLAILVAGGIGTFLIGAVIGLPVATLVISWLGRLPIHRRLIERKINRILAKNPQDYRHLHQQYWQANEENSRRADEENSRRADEENSRRSAHSGSDTGNEPSPYEVLGVRTDLPIDEIRKVYLELVKLYHPDKGIAPDGERLKKINIAWDRIQQGR